MPALQGDTNLHANLGAEWQFFKTVQWGATLEVLHATVAGGDWHASCNRAGALRKRPLLRFEVRALKTGHLGNLQKTKLAQLLQ